MLSNAILFLVTFLIVSLIIEEIRRTREYKEKLKQLNKEKTEKKNVITQDDQKEA